MNKDLQKNPVPTISGESIDFSNAIRVSGLVGLTEESLFKKVLEQTHIAHKEEKSKMIGRLINSEKWKFTSIECCMY